jgi:hypothetical protein
MNNDSNIGLPSDHLKSVFPYHVAVDEEFRIIQVGEKLKEFYEKSTGQSLLGKSMKQMFTLVVPSKISLNWKSVRSMGSDTTYKVDFELLGLSDNNCIPLKGKLIISDPNKNAAISKLSGLFIFELEVKNNQDLIHYGLCLNDVSKYCSQRDLLRLGK